MPPIIIYAGRHWTSLLIIPITNIIARYTDTHVKFVAILVRTEAKLKMFFLIKLMLFFGNVQPADLASNIIIPYIPT